MMTSDNGTAATAESPSEVVAEASVALDIGDGFGALIIYPAERYRGREIEISAVDGDGHRVHTGVHERATFSGTRRLTAVFGSLPAGEYVIWAEADTEGPTVSIATEEIAELHLG